MRILYYKSAWGDIKNSPGWFGKLCLLSLIALIPVFGQIVVAAYLYGWAREIAWGTHEPLPSRIFSDDDGKFWRRGWFAFVISFVFALVPSVIVSVGSLFQGAGLGTMASAMNGVSSPLFMGLGSILNLVGFLGALLCVALAWIGTMRMTLYDRLSAGFQIGKIWKMLRHDVTGMLKIYGMSLLVSFILVTIWYLLFFLIMGIVVAIGAAAAMGAGLPLDARQSGVDAAQATALMQVILAAGAFGLIGMLVAGFAMSLISVFVQMLVCRALGYWTMQFDVPHWAGQDDPMPFELQQPQPQAQPQPQPPYYQQPQYQQPPAQQYQAAPQQQAQVPQQQAQVPQQQAQVPVPTAVQQPQPQPQPADQQQPTVQYDERVVVGPEFIMSPDTISQLEAEVAEQRAELDAQGTHGVQDGQASDAHIGEDGEPHVGQPEGGEPQD